MKARYGDAAIRQIWFYLKKSTLLGTEDVIFSALGVKEEEFNEQFSLYLRETIQGLSRQTIAHRLRKGSCPFRPSTSRSFRRPLPRMENGLRFFTANRDDYEFDILMIDRTGKVLENLTGGLTTSYDYITTDDYRFEGRNISWSSDGSRLAYFARTGKRRSLFIVDASNGKRLKKIKLKLDQAASPSISPDGKTVVITGFLNGQPDLFVVDVETGKYQARHQRSAVRKDADVFFGRQMDLLHQSNQFARSNHADRHHRHGESSKQLTTSDYNSTSPFYDATANRVYYSADRNGAYNLYSLDLKTGDKMQYTDVIGGNFSPGSSTKIRKIRLAFTSILQRAIPAFRYGPARADHGDCSRQRKQQAAKRYRRPPRSSRECATSGPPQAHPQNSREFPMQGPVLSDFHPNEGSSGQQAEHPGQENATACRWSSRCHHGRFRRHTLPWLPESCCRISWATRNSGSTSAVSADSSPTMQATWISATGSSTWQISSSMMTSTFITLPHTWSFARDSGFTTGNHRGKDVWADESARSIRSTATIVLNSALASSISASTSRTRNSETPTRVSEYPGCGRLFVGRRLHAAQRWRLSAKPRNSVNLARLQVIRSGSRWTTRRRFPKLDRANHLPSGCAQVLPNIGIAL